jgi:ubiquinone/menaquinone biosynthesis C-methylase UbiE
LALRVRQNFFSVTASFDHIAASYDSSFTNTAIGTLQRKLVWNYIETIIHELPGIEILELNCGTGEDAVLFGERGFNIVATDISMEMLKVTEQKARQASLQHKVHVRHFDIEAFDETLFDKKFDLIFSNFGGLNCIPPDSMKTLLKKIPSILNPEGRMIAVIMPKHCLWESVYFLLKFQLGKAFRRWTSQAVRAHVAGNEVDTWYYNPSQIKKMQGQAFSKIVYRPIGLALPPSYLGNYFASRHKILMWLNSQEKKLQPFTFLSKFADHFIIDLKLT